MKKKVKSVKWRNVKNEKKWDKKGKWQKRIKGNKENGKKKEAKKIENKNGGVEEVKKKCRLEEKRQLEIEKIKVMVEKKLKSWN